MKYFAPLVAFALALPLISQAGERRFTYIYETTTQPKGVLELENYVTWKHYDDKERYEFRHELEYGVTDRFQLALYVADWRITDSDEDGVKGEYRDTAVEAIYSLTHPATDIIGSALYGEIKLGPELFVLEGKLLLQKDFENWTIAYNGTLEAEWEGDGYEEEVGEIAQSLGVSYSLASRVSVGAEALYEVAFPEWSDAEDGVLYAGPNFRFGVGEVFVTLTAMWQLTDVEGEADFQTRAIVGFHF